MSNRREPMQAREIQRSSLLRGPEWEAIVAAVRDEHPDADVALERLPAA